MPLLLAPAARGQIQGASSIEWRVAEAELVVRGNVLNAAEGKDDTAIGFRPLTLSVVETIKGALPPGGVLTALVYPPNAAAEGKGAEVLAFLVPAQAQRLQTGPADGQGGHGSGELPVMVATSLIPSGGPSASPAAYRMDGSAVRRFDEACDSARKAAAHIAVPLRRDPKSANLPMGFAINAAGERVVSLWAPKDTDVYKTLNPGGASVPQHPVFLNVPADDRLEQLAHRWALERRNPHHVIQILQCFESPQINSTLRLFLDDPTYNVQGVGKAARWRHPLRTTAYETLRLRGVSAPPPEDDMPVDAYRPIIARQAGGVALGGLGAVLGVVTVGALVRVRRAGARARRPGFFRLAWRATVLFALLASAAAVFLRFRSQRRVDEVTFSTRSGTHWVSTYRGGLQIVSVADWPGVAPLARATFELGACPDSPWTDGGVLATRNGRWAGFRRVEGTLAVNRRFQRPYQSTRVPLWSVALVLAALPVVVGASVVRRRLRTSRWRRQGRCTTCGYDLRGGHTQCPECGEAGGVPDAIAGA